MTTSLNSSVNDVISETNDEIQSENNQTIESDVGPPSISTISLNA